MTIQIYYFASLRDSLGRARDTLEATADLTVAEVWGRLHPDVPMPPNMLAAVNLEYAELTQRVHEGDELGFFPPVTGG